MSGSKFAKCRQMGMQRIDAYKEDLEFCKSAPTLDAEPRYLAASSYSSTIHLLEVDCDRLFECGGYEDDAEQTGEAAGRSSQSAAFLRCIVTTIRFLVCISRFVEAHRKIAL